MQSINVKNLSINDAVKPAEIYIPLWWSSDATGPSTTISSLVQCLQQGTTSETTTPTDTSPAVLYTHSLDWSIDTICALECTLKSLNNSQTLAKAALFDLTTMTAVAGSICTTTTAMTENNYNVVRSGNFKIIPTHKYSVTFYATNTANTIYIKDVSLIIFP